MICKDIRIWRAAIKEKSRKQNSEQPIWENGRLLDFIEIAGTHYRFPDDVLNKMIHENDKLDLCREPENTHDSNAVAVYTQKGEHIGYVPQKRNPLVSALMDGGSELFAKVYAKCVFEEKLHVAIEIYIKD